MENNIPPNPGIYKQVSKWQDLWFFQKAEVLYQMTFVFCERFLPAKGDRTVDQMIQSARSGKQNIVEGSEDGKTSFEMEIKLLNVARASIGELRQDYGDFLISRKLKQWKNGDERFARMQDFTKKHNKLADYEPFFNKWTAEEMSNVGLTLCFQVDTMMNKYMKKLETEFVAEGGIKERMHQARTGFRKQQDKRIAELELQNAQLAKQLAEANANALKWESAYNDLKKRAINAFNNQKEEIESLKLITKEDKK